MQSVSCVGAGAATLRALVPCDDLPLLYLIDKSVAFSLPVLTATIDLTLLADNTRAFLTQLDRAGVTHALYARTSGGAVDRKMSWAENLEDTMERMFAAGCARSVKDIPARIITSRTMSRGRGQLVRFRVAALDDLDCPALVERIQN